MVVADAQRDVRLTFMGGFPGQTVSGAIWLLSAALGTWASPRMAILVLVVGGVFIFPLTQLLLRAMGRRASLAQGNPLALLAMQIAFTVPLGLPLVGAAAIHRLDWFYPAFLIVVGAHYLPFVFLYGMGMYALLATLMITGGLWIGIAMSAPFATGGWFGGGVLLAFALVGLAQAVREERSGPP